MREYYIIRRKKDKLPYGKNYHWNTTGNHKPRQGFDQSFPPYLYSEYRRAYLALKTNKTFVDCNVEICRVRLTVKEILLGTE